MFIVVVLLMLPLFCCCYCVCCCSRFCSVRQLGPAFDGGYATHQYLPLRSARVPMKVGPCSFKSREPNAVDQDTAVNDFQPRSCGVATGAPPGLRTSRQCVDPGLIARFGSFTVQRNRPERTALSDTVRAHWISGPRLKTFAVSAKPKRSMRSNVINQ